LQSYFFSALGAAIALAGGDKLAGQRGYRDMFHGLGWSEASMRTAATAELVGGLLMLLPSTRRLGGAVVAVTSATVLATEIGQGETKLALPRSLVLLLGLVAVADQARQRA
jgi:hypothetical protein